MGKKFVIFVEDSNWIGIWPSYADAIKELLDATDGGDLTYIDATVDGRFLGTGFDRLPFSAYQPGPVRQTSPIGWTFIAVETENTDMTPGTKDYYGVNMRDASNGLLVGEQGWSQLTSDGGYHRSLLAIHSELLRSADVLDEDWAYAVGNNGTIMQTEDGGLSWLHMVSGTSVDLYDVVFPHDKYVGWAVGVSGKILRTEDRETWLPQTSGTTMDLYSVSFPPDDEDNGWAVGESGTIIHTTDAGVTWAAQTSGTVEHLYCVDFMNTTHGIAAGDTGTILTTDDGGTTWTARTSGTLKDLHGCAQWGTDHWICGLDGTILTSSDSGVTWAAQTSGTALDLFGISFGADDLSGIAVGKSGVVLVTADGGTTWTTPVPYVKEPLSTFTHPTNAVYVFGPHNGLHKDYIMPDVHLYLDGYTGTLDVRDVISIVANHRFGQIPTEA